MKRCKVTALKTTLDKELAAGYGAEELHLCPVPRCGQEAILTINYIPVK